VEKGTAHDQGVLAELRIAFPDPAETNGGRSLGAALLRRAVVPPREPQPTRAL